MDQRTHLANEVCNLCGDVAVAVAERDAALKESAQLKKKAADADRKVADAPPHDKAA